MIAQTTGLVVKGNCVKSLTIAMQTLITDDAKRRRMGQAARQYMENRSFEAAFDKNLGNVWQCEHDKAGSCLKSILLFKLI